MDLLKNQLTRLLRYDLEALLYFLRSQALLLAVILENIKGRFSSLISLFPSAAISGFIGGLTGNQGAFRSLFLLKANLDKHAYIATGAAISFLVDIVRLIFYYHLFPSWKLFLPDILPALLGSVFGAFVGMYALKKVGLQHIRILVCVLLYGCGFAFLLGIL